MPICKVLFTLTCKLLRKPQTLYRQNRHPLSFYHRRSLCSYYQNSTHTSPEFLADGLRTKLVYFSADTQNFGPKYQNIGKKAKEGASPEITKKYTCFAEKILEVKSLQQSHLKKLIKSRKNFIMVNDSASSARALELFQEALVALLKIDSESLARYMQERLPKLNPGLNVNEERQHTDMGDHKKRLSVKKKDTGEKQPKEVKEEIEIMTRLR